jgi:hypothetical protein
MPVAPDLSPREELDGRLGTLVVDQAGQYSVAG